MAGAVLGAGAFVSIAVLACVMEFVDSIVGMGFGATMSAVLASPHLFGFTHKSVVLSIMLTEVCSGVCAFAANLLFGNLPRPRRQHKQTEKQEKSPVPSGTTTLPSPEGESHDSPAMPTEDGKPFEEVSVAVLTTPAAASDQLEEQQQEMNKETTAGELKREWGTVGVLVVAGAVGTSATIVVSQVLENNAAFAAGTQLYLGLLIAVLSGFLAQQVLAHYACVHQRRTVCEYKVRRVAAAGLVAGANLGLTGGGFGAVAITALLCMQKRGPLCVAASSAAHTVASVIGILVALCFSVSAGDFFLAPALLTGSVLAVVPASFALRYVNQMLLRAVLAVVGAVLGIYTIVVSSISLASL